MCDARVSMVYAMLLLIFLSFKTVAVLSGQQGFSAVVCLSNSSHQEKLLLPFVESDLLGCAMSRR